MCTVSFLKTAKMTLKLSNAIVIFSIIFLKFVSVNGDSNSVQFLNGTGPVASGLCNIEVPTIELLTPEQRQSGVIPTGNGTRPGYSSIKACCKGWRVKPHTAFKCEPICENGCHYGNCTAPNVCICLPGHSRDLEGNCIPTCPKACLNGICTEDGSCSCNPGYYAEPRRQYCLPRCNRDCGLRGKCTAPEVCTCQKGYIWNSGNGLCEYHDNYTLPPYKK